MLTQFILISGIIVLFMILYLSIVPCKNKENFELPEQISNMIDQRTEMLKEQTISANIFQSAVDEAIGEIRKLKDKLILLHEESNSDNNSVLMFNTNGQITKVA